jgi:uncharacterized protein (TIGR03435 family)
MTRTLLGTVWALSMFGAALGQTADAPLAFEVASIKRTLPDPGTGGRATGCFPGTGPGIPSPGLYTCLNATVSLMAFEAYNLKSYQIGPAYHSDTTEYNVTAKSARGRYRGPNPAHDAESAVRAVQVDIPL